VLQRRVPHPSHLTRPLRRVKLSKTRPPRIGIKAMMYAHPRHILTRCGIHFRITQMGHCNGFRSRLCQSVRTFTVKLVKARSELLCTKFVGKNTTRRTTSHRTKLYICTLLDPRFKNYNMCPTLNYVTIHTYAQSVCSVTKLNDRG
jgi:hypothetical protein